MSNPIRPRTQKLMGRFADAKIVGDANSMLSILKRLGYKKDCPSEEIIRMRRDAFVVRSSSGISHDPKTGWEI